MLAIYNYLEWLADAKGGKKMKNLLLTVVLLVLVAVAVVQAVQLNSLKESIASGAVAKSTGSSSSSVNTQSGSGTPKSLQDLPQMVGGC